MKKPIETKEIAVIKFNDVETNEEALVIVRASRDVVLLTLSLKSDGDIEVGMSRSECEQIKDALHGALGMSQA